MAERQGLIFTEEDVKKAPNMLSKIIRKIFIKQNITYYDFKEYINEYVFDRYNGDPTVEQCIYSNYLKAILDNNHGITWKMFNALIDLIIGLSSSEVKFSDNIVDAIVSDILSQK
jgi:hypothetical protein